MSDLSEKREQLLKQLRSLESCAVAFSGGVDSTVLAKAAQLALGDKTVAVTATSSTMAEGELDEAKQLADLIGIRHEIIVTKEEANPDFMRNAPDRCYHCRMELFRKMDKLAERLGVAVIVDGANADDLADYRPGRRAAEESGIRSPLLECSINKQEIRALAAEWALPVWDKPAMPCLASRVAYGEELAPERLARIDRAEQYLRGLGLRTVRVRYHKGDLARLEVPLDALPRLCQVPQRDDLVGHLLSLGFKYVTLDLQGFRSGSLNETLPLEVLERSQSG